MSYHCFLPVFSGAGLDGFRRRWFGWIQTAVVWMDSDGGGLDGFRAQGAGRRAQGRRVAGSQGRRVQGRRVQGRRVQGRRAQGSGRRVAGAQGSERRGAEGKNFGQNVLGVATKKAPSSFLGLERALDFGQNVFVVNTRQVATRREQLESHRCNPPPSKIDRLQGFVHNTWLQGF